MKAIKELIKLLLIVLFVYAAVSKLVDFDLAKRSMLNQPIPRSLAEVLAWTIPLSELLTAGLLLFKTTILAGFYLSLGLMTAFTLYITMALLHVFSRVPCSCGGVLQKMGWQTHFFFNLFFLTLIIIGIIITNRERRPGDTT